MRGVAVATASAVAIGSLTPAGGQRPEHVGPPAAPMSQQRHLSSSAVFNIPSGSPEERNAIVHHVDDLAAAAPRGALIRIAIYEFTSERFARTLVAASRRGVQVQLVVDVASRRSTAYRMLLAALGTARDRPSWLVTCAKGCIGDTINHNKFYLFSRTGADDDVVVQASANLTDNNRVNAWNNAFTISDPGLYRAYGRYFTALAAHRHQDAHYSVNHSGDVTAYTFPRAATSGTSDTLYGLLGHVGCDDGTTVDVTTYSLTRSRIARRLWSLAHDGCGVRIIYTNLGPRARRILVRPGGPKLLNSHYRYIDHRTGKSVGAWVHSKYVAIDGDYEGDRRALVITGSPNLTTPALRENDETMLVVDDEDICAAYQDNFADLWRAAHTYTRLVGRVADPR
jgi:phosphatidylserine/phosphatidylglycerophosphate/cardiolipin synthase-like enzyme